MCRLFAFRSIVPAAVHDSLVTEKNSLLAQSREHKDGWGIVSYVNGALPDAAHGLGAAHADPDFERVSNRLSSRTVLAHVRLASVGAIELPNAHPFLHGRWAFAHNGTVRHWDTHRAAVEKLLRPDFRALLRGSTDSERLFYLFLTHLEERCSLAGPCDAEDVARALARTMAVVARLTDAPGQARSSLNLVATDGDVLVATRRNRTLFFSESKPRGAPDVEPPRPGTQLEQIVIASEELSGEDHWHSVGEEEAIGVDARLRLHRWRVCELM
jgi:predicted glutamine amidotransferase